MEETYHKDKTLTGSNYAEKVISKQEFEHCTFINCDFSNANLSDSSFRNCSFDHCNLSLVKLNRASLVDVLFKGCKLLGVDLSVSNDFSFSVKFETCVLDYASFFKKRLKKTTFKDCKITEANFSEADLSNALFLNCDLTRSFFNRTILNSADFTTSTGLSLDPEVNTLKKAKFALNTLPGLLEKYGIIVEQ